MPNRIIKETILTSPNFKSMTAEAERHFYRILLTTDDHGCLESSPAVLRGRCYPLKDDVTTEQCAKWTAELEDAGIIRTWPQDERQYAVFVNFEKHNARYGISDEGGRTRHRRKTPEPPADIMQVIATLPQEEAGVPHPQATKPLDYSPEFEEFWRKYPNNKNKRRSYACWEERMKEGVIAKELIDAAANYSIICDHQKTEIKFRLHGSTFLGPNERWKEYADIEQLKRYYKLPAGTQQSKSRWEVMKEKQAKIGGTRCL